MTAPKPHIDVIAGVPLSPDTLVIQSRPVRDGTDPRRLPRFGDARWDLSACNDDCHSASQAVHWSAYPAATRESIKQYLFALVNVVEDPPFVFKSNGRAPSIKTIWSDLVGLRSFLKWVDAQHISSLSAVTVDDLNNYVLYIQDYPDKSPNWRRRALVAVQRLHAYRDELPTACRLPAVRLWNGASAAALAGDPGPHAVNLTPRLDSTVIETLLSAALLTTTTIAADLLPVAKRLVDLRTVAYEIAESGRVRPREGGERLAASRAQFDRLITTMVERQMPLPAVTVGDDVVLDTIGLSVGGWVCQKVMSRDISANRAQQSGLPLNPNWLVVQRFTPIDDHRWRHDPMRADDVITTIRHVITACFLVITYLSGVRTGEALNLHRGCITHDRKLGLTFMSGMQLKTTGSRRERSMTTVPWVVIPQVADAVRVLEQLSTGELLFPSGQFCSADWINRAFLSARTPGSINTDLRAFITWFNSQIAEQINHPPIPDDPDGRIVAPRLRRTLAWHIVRRPGGLVAGATQYGHLSTQVMQGYAGLADSGFANDVEFETLLARAERLHDDAQQLAAGEEVSGAAADEYRHRLAARPTFAGTTVASRAQLKFLSANPALAIHHGALLTCVYRPESAACRQDRHAHKPDWARCRLTCTNVAYTDRDIDAVRTEVDRLAGLITTAALPEPLLERIRLRHTHLRTVLANHDDNQLPTTE